MYSRIWSVSKLRDVLIFILFNQFKNGGRKKETEPGLMIQVKMSCTLRTRDIPTTFWNNQLCFKKACTKTSWLKYEMNFDKPSCYVSPCCSYLYRLHTSLHYTAKNWKSLTNLVSSEPLCPNQFSTLEIKGKLREGMKKWKMGEKSGTDFIVLVRTVLE